MHPPKYGQMRPEPKPKEKKERLEESGLVDCAHIYKPKSPRHYFACSKIEGIQNYYDLGSAGKGVFRLLGER